MAGERVIEGEMPDIRDLFGSTADNDTDGAPWEALTKYAAHEASDADVAAVRQWAANSQNRERYIARLQAVWDARDVSATWTPDVDAIRQTVQARIAQQPIQQHSYEQRTSVFGPPLSRSIGPQRPLMRSIGLFALVLAVCGITYRLFHRTTSANTVEHVGRVYSTARAERETIRLADGSSVVLAPQSRLIVPSDFGNDQRTIQLQGEAYFTVASHTRAPFIVNTGTITTRVLGTAFDIRDNSVDASSHVGVRIAVLQGKVRVTGHKSMVTLAAGQIGHVTDSTAATTTSDDLLSETAWTDGRLLFRNASVRSVLATLSRWSQYDFRLADSSLANRNVTVTFDVKNSMETFLTLRHVLDVTLHIDGNVITIVPGRDPAAQPIRRGSEPSRLHLDQLGRE